MFESTINGAGSSMFHSDKACMKWKPPLWDFGLIPRRSLLLLSSYIELLWDQQEQGIFYGAARIRVQGLQCEADMLKPHGDVPLADLQQYVHVGNINLREDVGGNCESQRAPILNTQPHLPS